MFLLGTWGAGKSHLAAAAIKAAGKGIFITMHDLVGELRQSYSENSGVDDMVDKYRNAEVLVLDEVSLDVFDPDSKKGLDIPPLMYRVLGYRHDKDLFTVFTANHDIDVVLRIFGPKLRDRMKESYEIANCKWESYRKDQKKL